MRILAYKWKAYNHRDIMQAFRIRGYEIDEIEAELANFEKDDIFEKRLEKMLFSGEENKYDFVFSVNYFPLISDICEKYKIKYVCWTCDSPLSTMYHQSIFNKCNYIFIFDKISWMTFDKMGARVYYLPLAASVERSDYVIQGYNKSKSIVKGAFTDKQYVINDNYESDVTFIGSMYNKNSYDEVEMRLPEYVRGYFDALMRMQMDIYGDNYIDKMLTADIIGELNKHFRIEKSERSFSDISLIFSTTVLGFKIAQMERLKLINSLSKRFEINVYTDDEKADFPLANNKGPVDYWNLSPVVFNRSKINLNFTIRNIRSGIPLRVWDILAAGGFCITNFQLELPMYFENGKDLVWFEDERDLIQKTAYYLKHEEERKEIAFRGYTKVKQMHSYGVRIEEMEKIIWGI